MAACSSLPTTWHSGPSLAAWTMRCSGAWRPRRWRRRRRADAGLDLWGPAAGGLRLRRASRRRQARQSRQALQKLDETEAAAQRDPALLARAGWFRYLIASDPRGAALKLDAAARASAPGQRALALAGLGEIAED